MINALRAFRTTLKDWLDRVWPGERACLRMDLILKVLLVAIALAVFWGNVDQVYKIPVNKPYFDGEWDEPFAINAGINIIRFNGDPVFYNYGGTTSYSHALIFYLYCNSKGISPYYQEMDTRFKNPGWPINRKIYPVKPIYIAKVVSYIIFLAGAFFYVGLFTLLLLPAVFWLLPSVLSGPMMSYMASQMLPETHLTLLAGFTALFFAKAILAREKKKGDLNHYFRWLILCAVFASLTTAAKLNAAYIVALPLSLLWKPFREKFMTWKRTGMVSLALVLPYVLVNPAILFNISRYKDWLLEMSELSGTSPGIWADRIKPITQVLNELYLYKTLPLAAVILLAIWAGVVIFRRNPVAFGGFLFFMLYSFVTIANMKHAFYGRHLMFLVLPFGVFLLFPFIEIFQRAGVRLKAAITLACLIITLWIYPPHKVVGNIFALKGKSFTNSWKQESRDRLAKFAKTNNSVLYFYDYHGFSLPETIYHQIIPFSNIDELPEQLKDNEYVAFIRYKKAGKGVFNPIDKYGADVRELRERYKTFRVFGKRGGAHDINDQSPLGNPTILLMKAKNRQKKQHESKTGIK